MKTKRMKAVVSEMKSALFGMKSAPSVTTRVVAARRRVRVLLASASLLTLLTFALGFGVTRGAAQSSQSPWMVLPPLPVKEKGFPALLGARVGAGLGSAA